MVFISYSSIDYAVASNVRSILRQNGIECWMAPESIPAGSDYGEEIPTAIEACDAFVLVLSENSQNSKWVPKEIDLAITNDKIIIPLHIDDKQLNKSFNFRLTNTQRIEAYQQTANAFNELIGRVSAISGIKSQTSPVSSSAAPAQPKAPASPPRMASAPKNWPNIFQNFKNKYSDIKSYRFIDLNHEQGEALFKKVRLKFAPYEDNEIPLMAYDSTFFGSCKEGFLLSDRKLYVSFSLNNQIVSFSYDEITEWFYRPCSKNPAKEAYVKFIANDREYYFCYCSSAVEAQDFCALLKNIQGVVLS